MNDNFNNNNIEIQKSAQTEGTMVPQAGTSVERMELVKKFHAELIENTMLINEERRKYVGQLAKAKRLYDKQMDLADKQMMDIQIERDALNASITANKAELLKKEKAVRNLRRVAYDIFTEEKTVHMNNHANRNLELQNERHMIFERYKKFGGGQISQSYRNSSIQRESEPKPMMEG